MAQNLDANDIAGSYRVRSTAIQLALVIVVLALLSGGGYIYFFRPVWHCHGTDCLFRDMGIRFAAPKDWDVACTGMPRPKSSDPNATVEVRVPVPTRGYETIDQAFIGIDLNRANGLSIEEWYQRDNERRRLEVEHSRRLVDQNAPPWNPKLKQFSMSIGGEPTFMSYNDEAGKYPSLRALMVKYGDAIYVIIPYNASLPDFDEILKTFLGSIKFVGTPDLRPHRPCIDFIRYLDFLWGGPTA